MPVPSHVKQHQQIQQQIYVNFHRQTHPLLSLFIILVNFTQNVSYADLQSNLHQRPLFFVPADSPYIDSSLDLYKTSLILMACP